MAGGRIKGITVEIGGDTTSLDNNAIKLVLNSSFSVALNVKVVVSENRIIF